MSLEISVFSEDGESYGHFRYRFYKDYDQTRKIYKLEDVNFPCFNVPSNFYFIINNNKSPIIRLPEHPLDLSTIHPTTNPQISDSPQTPPNHMENNIWKQVRVGNQTYQIKFVLSKYYEFSDYDQTKMTYNIYKPTKFVTTSCKKD